jgi:hypothetical protein
MAFLDIQTNIDAIRNKMIATFSFVLLQQLTNQGHIDPTTAVIITPIMDQAIKDAGGEFEHRSGHEIQLSDETHLAAVSQGAIGYLYSYKGGAHKTQEQYFIRFISMTSAIKNATQVPSASTNDLNTAVENNPIDNIKIFPDMSRVYHSNYLPTKRRGPRRGYGDRSDNFC